MHTLEQLQSGQLAGIRRLDLQAGLSEFPRDIFQLADSLEVLNLSGNRLDSLPADLHRLHRLKVLFCSDNRFTHLPDAVGACPRLELVGFKANQIAHVGAAALPPRLRWLILTDNRIGELPDELGACGRLQKLMLAGNRLQRLPDSMAACQRLELVRIAANELGELPAWLPTLPRLAWLAYAGNPFCADDDAAALALADVPAVAWQSLQLHGTLGEGASGVIHRASWWTAPGQAHPVAVKRFKGEVTSDGSPLAEMAACIAAGSHPNLIGAQARISGHPDGTLGLVMPLIDSAFQNLAGPPSLDSCTRDVYAAGTRFALSDALHLARGVASAVQQLHARGILHGDLYAHNILRNGRSDCLLGDFGAASMLPRHDTALAQALMRTEVRAFACLLEELIERCDASATDASVVQALRELQLHCDHKNPAARPAFAEIHTQLAALG